MKEKKGAFISLKLKIMAGIILMGFAIGALGVASISFIAGKIVDSQYADKSECLSRSIAEVVDPDEARELADKVISIYLTIDNPVTSDDWGSPAFNEYIANYAEIEQDPLFIKLRDTLRTYQDINGVDCVYLGLVDLKNKCVLYLVDADYDDPCPPGCIDRLYDMNAEHARRNEVWPAYITNEPMYGWLVTSGAPVGYSGEFLIYAENDISMEDIRAEERLYVIIMTLAMSLMVLLAMAVGIYFTGKHIVDPVQELSETARNYHKSGRDSEHHDFEQLVPRTNDEIAQLLFAMQQMERDMNSNVEDLASAKTELQDVQTELHNSVIKAEEMTEQAMKDGLTHVGNKAAYELAVEKIAVEMMQPGYEFGVAMIDLNYLKRINDTYGHEVGDMAIKSLCAIICDVFSHSPVYRIGGDEFVVIVKNRDYENADFLLEKARQLLDGDGIDVAPYEAVSAAVGYAVYEDSDSEYQDVFRRADNDMYQNKKKMHGGRE